jgi:hypothetical protein
MRKPTLCQCRFAHANEADSGGGLNLIIQSFNALLPGAAIQKQDLNLWAARLDVVIRK